MMWQSADNTHAAATLVHPSSSQVQNRLGADIIMALDDVVPSTAADDARFEEATHRTTRWIDRCIAAHGRPTEQNLFAIVQVRPESLIVGGFLWRGDGFVLPEWHGSTGPSAYRHSVASCIAGSAPA